MADEKSGPRPLGDRPEDHDPSLFTEQPTPVGGLTSGLESRRSEWTASDERGALHQAPPPDAIRSEAGRAGPAGATVATEFGSSAARDAAPAAQTSAAPKRSLWPVAAGLVVGAAIGAGSAAVIYGMQKNGDNGLDQKIASLSSRVDTLDQRPDPRRAIAGLQTSMSALDGKVADAQKTAAAADQNAQKAAQAAGKPGAAAFDPAPLEQKIATLQSSVDALQKQAGGGKDVDGKLASLQASIDDLRKRDRAQGDTLGATQSAVGGLRKQDDDQGSKIAAFAATAVGLQSLQGKVSNLEKQTVSTQQGVMSLQADQKTLAAKVRDPAFAAVSDSLVSQIERGEPYEQQVEALAALNADPAKVAVLRENAAKGVPSAQALAAQFKPLADPMTAVEYKAPPNAGLYDRLKSGMSSLVSVRSTDETAGNDIASRVSLIQADLNHNDVVGAVAAWNQLPPDAKARSQAWGALAKTSAEAMTAARALREQAIAAFSGKKS